MGRVPDLSTLNPAEREALALLARGHTAKSIASITGRSVGSINERLREARRKTGVGSSRELARLYATQENRDEQIGVGNGQPGVATAPEVAAAVARGSRKGIVLMGFALLSGIAALALVPGLVSHPQEATGDPEFNITFPEAKLDTRNLHAQVRRETRDPAWAAPTEQAIRTRYAKLVHADRMTRPVRVICGATICEVAGLLPDGNLKLINETMDEMQVGALPKDLEKLGLKSGSQLFGKGNFIAYWMREGA
jgi:DNA-binding CsgD family transcriptional regulator/head-tail adaptor